METLKPLVREIFRQKLKEFSQTLPKREFISKQVSVIDTRIRLLSFLGRKEGNIELVIEGDEEIVINISRHSSKTIRVVLLNDFEKFKWDET